RLLAPPLPPPLPAASHAAPRRSAGTPPPAPTPPPRSGDPPPSAHRPRRRPPSACPAAHPGGTRTRAPAHPRAAMRTPGPAAHRPAARPTQPRQQRTCSARAAPDRRTARAAPLPSAAPQGPDPRRSLGLLRLPPGSPRYAPRHLPSRRSTVRLAPAGGTPAPPPPLPERDTLPPATPPYRNTCGAKRSNSAAFSDTASSNRSGFHSSIRFTSPTNSTEPLSSAASFNRAGTRIRPCASGTTSVAFASTLNTHIRASG